MANEANIDIEINNADVDRLIGSLADLSRTLDGLTSEFRSTGRAADDAADDLDKIEKELKDVETAARGAEQGVALMGAAAAGVAVAFAAFEAGKMALESFAASNEEAAARMEILNNSATSLIGSFGQIMLGGENSSQTLEILTQTFEGLQEIVMNNSELLSGMATTVLRALVRGFFFLIDSGLSVVEFFAQLDTNLLKVELGFTNLKISALEFADSALEGIGNFVAGAIERFADLLSALDDVQTAIVDNPVIRTLFGIDDETVITGPVGALADGLRSAAESIRTSTTGRFAGDIADAALKAEVLNEMISETANPIRETRNELMELGYELDNMFENIHTQAARGIDVEVRLDQVSGGGGGRGGARQEMPPLIDLEEQLNTSENQLQTLEQIYADNLARLLAIAAERTAQLQDLALAGDKGELVPGLPNAQAMIMESEAMQQYFEWATGVQKTRQDILELQEEIQATEEDIQLAQQRSAAAASRRQSGSALLQAIPSMMVEEAQDALRQLTDGYEEIHQEALRRTQYVVDTAGGMSGSGERDTYLEFLVDVYQEREQAAIAAERTLQQNLAAERQRQQARLAELEQSNADQNYNEQLSRIQEFYNDAKNEIQDGYEELRASVEAGNATIVSSYAEGLAQQRTDLAELLAFRAGIQGRLDELYTGFGMRGDRDRRNELIDLEQQRFSSAQEGIDAITAALTRQERKWIETNGGLEAYITAVEESKEATREAFKDTGIDIFEDSIAQIGSFLGQTLAQSFDDGLTGAERTKKFLAEMLGGFLQTIGQVAIAQAAVVAFGDPAAGGLPNPVRAAGLAAAGLAAITAGSALSGVASKISASTPTNPTTTPASVGGGGGGGGTSETTTNIFIENRFANRFDARELDRAAADSFARAASAGQA